LIYAVSVLQEERDVDGNEDDGEDEELNTDRGECELWRI
jgi:hypothetical protein